MRDDLSADLESLRLPHEPGARSTRETVPPGRGGYAPNDANVAPRAGDVLSTDLHSLSLAHVDEPSGRRRTTGRSLVAAFVVVAMIVAVGGAGYNLYTLARKRLATTSVQTTEVSVLAGSEGGTVSFSASGYVVAQTLIKLAPLATGLLARVNVKEGEFVRAGQPLFVFDSQTRKSALMTARAKLGAAQARVTAARAALLDLQQQAAREKKLAASGLSSKGTADDVEARKGTAAAQVAVAQADAAAAAAEVGALQNNLHELSVSSPINGRAVSKPAAIGDVVTPTQTLVEIADFSSLLVEVDVTETRLGAVKIGTPCEVMLDAFATKKFRGEVVEVNPRINRAKATGTVKVKIVGDPAGVLPEMAGRVNFLAEPPSENGTIGPRKSVIPKSAVVERGGDKVAFVVDNHRVHATKLTLGAVDGAVYEVVDGPPVGTRVVDSPPSSLQDGQAIKEDTER